MKIEISELNAGWFRIVLGLKTEDVDEMIMMLKTLKKDKKKRFHLINKFKEESGVSDFEFFVLKPSEEDNLQIADS